MWTRRRLLALILLSSLAKGGEDEAKRGKKKEEEKEEKKGKKKEDEEKEGRFPPLYGPVEGVMEEGLWVAGQWVRPEGELWAFMAPGMVVAVAGRRVQVVEPRTWAYFQGPGPWVGASSDWVRVWWAEGRLWKRLKGVPGEALLVARFFGGRWESVPSLFRLPPAPREGWWRLRHEGEGWKLMAPLSPTGEA